MIDKLPEHVYLLHNPEHNEYYIRYAEELGLPADEPQQLRERDNDEIEQRGGVILQKRPHPEMDYYLMAFVSAALAERWRIVFGIADCWEVVAANTVTLFRGLADQKQPPHTCLVEEFDDDKGFGFTCCTHCTAKGVRQ